MVFIRSSDHAKKEIIDRYNKDPRNWQIYASKDRYTHNDLTIIHPSGIWLIKEHEINPFKTVGFSVKTKYIDIKSKHPSIDFGLRPIKKEMMEDILSVPYDNERLKNTIANILKTKPVSFHKIQKAPILQGPVYYTQTTNLLSQKHAELKRQLHDELEKLLLKNYPQTIIPYL